MEMETTINQRNFKGNAGIVELKGKRKLIVGKRKRICTNVQRLGREGTCKMRSRQAVSNNFWLASIVKIAQFLNFVADLVTAGKMKFIT